MKKIVNLSLIAALLMVAGSVIAAETKSQTQTQPQAVKEQPTTTQTAVQTDEEKAREICKKNRVETSRFDACVKSELEKIRVAKKETPSKKGAE